MMFTNCILVIVNISLYSLFEDLIVIIITIK